MVEWNIYDKKGRKRKVERPVDSLVKSEKEWDLGEILDTVDAHYRIIEEQLRQIKERLREIKRHIEVSKHEKKKKRKNRSHRN